MLPDDFDLDQWARDMAPVLTSVNLVASQTVLAEAQSMVAVTQAMAAVLRGTHHLQQAVAEEPERADELLPAAAAIEDVQAGTVELLGEMLPELVNVMRIDLGEPEITTAFNAFRPYQPTSAGGL